MEINWTLSNSLPMDAHGIDKKGNKYHRVPHGYYFCTTIDGKKGFGHSAQEAFCSAE